MIDKVLIALTMVVSVNGFYSCYEKDERECFMKCGTEKKGDECEACWENYGYCDHWGELCIEEGDAPLDDASSSPPIDGEEAPEDKGDDAPEDDKSEMGETPEDDKSEMGETPEDDKSEMGETPEDDKSEMGETPEDDKSEMGETPEDDKSEMDDGKPLAEDSPKVDDDDDKPKKSDVKRRSIAKLSSDCSNCEFACPARGCDYYFSSGLSKECKSAGCTESSTTGICKKCKQYEKCNSGCRSSFIDKCHIECGCGMKGQDYDGEESRNPQCEGDLCEECKESGYRECAGECKGEQYEDCEKDGCLDCWGAGCDKYCQHCFPYLHCKTRGLPTCISQEGWMCQKYCRCGPEGSKQDGNPDCVGEVCKACKNRRHCFAPKCEGDEYDDCVEWGFSGSKCYKFQYCLTDGRPACNKKPSECDSQCDSTSKDDFCKGCKLFDYCQCSDDEFIDECLRECPCGADSSCESHECGKCNKGSECYKSCESKMAADCREISYNGKECAPYKHCKDKVTCDDDAAKPCSTKCEWVRDGRSEYDLQPDTTSRPAYYYSRLCEDDKTCPDNLLYCDKCTSKSARKCMVDCRCGPEGNDGANPTCKGESCQGCMPYRECMKPCENTEMISYCSDQCKCELDDDKCTNDCMMRCDQYFHCLTNGALPCDSEELFECKLGDCRPSVQNKDEEDCQVDCSMFNRCENNFCTTEQANDCMVRCRCGPDGTNNECDGKVCEGCSPYLRNCMTSCDSERYSTCSNTCSQECTLGWKACSECFKTTKCVDLLHCTTDSKPLCKAPESDDEGLDKISMICLDACTGRGTRSEGSGDMKKGSKTGYDNYTPEDEHSPMDEAPEDGEPEPIWKLSEKCGKCTESYDHCEVSCESELAKLCIEECGTPGTPNCEVCKPYESCFPKCTDPAASSCEGQCEFVKCMENEPCEEWPGVEVGSSYLSCIKKTGEVTRCPEKYNFCSYCHSKEATRCMVDCRCGPSVYTHYNGMPTLNPDCESEWCEGCQEYRKCFLPCQTGYGQSCMDTCDEYFNEAAMKSPECEECNQYAHCATGGGLPCYHPDFAKCEFDICEEQYDKKSDDKHGDGKDGKDDDGGKNGKDDDGGKNGKDDDGGKDEKDGGKDEKDDKSASTRRSLKEVGKGNDNDSDEKKDNNGDQKKDGKDNDKDEKDGGGKDGKGDDKDNKDKGGDDFEFRPFLFKDCVNCKFFSKTCKDPCRTGAAKECMTECQCGPSPVMSYSYNKNPFCLGENCKACNVLRNCMKPCDDDKVDECMEQCQGDKDCWKENTCAPYAHCRDDGAPQCGYKSISDHCYPHCPMMRDEDKTDGTKEQNKVKSHRRALQQTDKGGKGKDYPAMDDSDDDDDDDGHGHGRYPGFNFGMPRLPNDECPMCISTHRMCEVDCDTPMAKRCVQECGCRNKEDCNTPECKQCRPYSECLGKHCKKDAAAPCHTGCRWEMCDTSDDSYVCDDMGWKRQCEEYACPSEYRNCDMCGTMQAQICLENCRCGPENYKYNGKPSANEDCGGLMCMGCDRFRECSLPCQGEKASWCADNCFPENMGASESKDCLMKCAPYLHCRTMGAPPCWLPESAQCQLSKEKPDGCDNKDNKDDKKDEDEGKEDDDTKKDGDEDNKGGDTKDGGGDNKGGDTKEDGGGDNKGGDTKEDGGGDTKEDGGGDNKGGDTKEDGGGDNKGGDTKEDGGGDKGGDTKEDGGGDNKGGDTKEDGGGDTKEDGGGDNKGGDTKEDGGGDNKGGDTKEDGGGDNKGGDTKEDGGGDTKEDGGGDNKGSDTKEDGGGDNKGGDTKEDGGGDTKESKNNAQRHIASQALERENMDKYDSPLDYFDYIYTSEEEDRKDGAKGKGDKDDKQCIGCDLFESCPDVCMTDLANRCMTSCMCGPDQYTYPELHDIYDVGMDLSRWYEGWYIGASEPKDWFKELHRRIHATSTEDTKNDNKDDNKSGKEDGNGDNKSGKEDGNGDNKNGKENDDKDPPTFPGLNPMCSGSVCDQCFVVRNCMKPCTDPEALECANCDTQACYTRCKPYLHCKSQGMGECGSKKADEICSDACEKISWEETFYEYVLDGKVIWDDDQPSYLKPSESMGGEWVATTRETLTGSCASCLLGFKDCGVKSCDSDIAMYCFENCKCLGGKCSPSCRPCIQFTQKCVWEEGCNGLCKQPCKWIANTMPGTVSGEEPEDWSRVCTESDCPVGSHCDSCASPMAERCMTECMCGPEGTNSMNPNCGGYHCKDCSQYRHCMRPCEEKPSECDWLLFASDCISDSCVKQCGPYLHCVSAGGGSCSLDIAKNCSLSTAAEANDMPDCKYFSNCKDDICGNRVSWRCKNQCRCNWKADKLNPLCLGASCKDCMDVNAICTGVYYYIYFIYFTSKLK